MDILNSYRIMVLWSLCVSVFIKRGCDMMREEAISRIQRALSVPNRLQGLVLIDEESANMAIEALSEPKRGKWKTAIRHEHYPSGKEYEADYCSVCGRRGSLEYNYCPCCGARMTPYKDGNDK